MAGTADASLVALLVSQPRMIATLGPAHADDGTGHCRSCSSGAQTGRYLYPCAIRLAGDEARRQLAEARRQLAESQLR
jgi:hypothetical protein